jgi:hypothetical protein
MDGMRSAVLVMSVDVVVTGSGPCIEPRDGFLDLKSFLKMRFISLMIKVKRERSLDYISEVCQNDTQTLASETWLPYGADYRNYTLKDATSFI